MMTNIWTSTQPQQDPSENIISLKQLLAFNGKRKNDVTSCVMSGTCNNFQQRFNKVSRNEGDKLW
jgi:hypothetical protein